MQQPRKRLKYCCHSNTVWIEKQIICRTILFYFVQPQFHKRHGRWVLRFADGDVAEGCYVNSREHGHWIVRSDWDGHSCLLIPSPLHVCRLMRISRLNWALNLFLDSRLASYTEANIAQRFCSASSCSSHQSSEILSSSCQNLHTTSKSVSTCLIIDTVLAIVCVWGRSGVIILLISYLEFTCKVRYIGCLSLYCRSPLCLLSTSYLSLDKLQKDAVSCLPASKTKR